MLGTQEVSIGVLVPLQGLWGFCPRCALYRKPGQVGGGGERFRRRGQKRPGRLPAATVLLFSYSPPGGAPVKLRSRLFSTLTTATRVCAHRTAHGAE